MGAHKQAPLYRISGATPALPGEFPYQVKLNYDLGEGEQFCSGMILTSYLILTAAHCFKRSTKQGTIVDINWAHVGVTAGRWEIRKVSNGSATNGSQISSLPHPHSFNLTNESTTNDGSDIISSLLAALKFTIESTSNNESEITSTLDPLNFTNESTTDNGSEISSLPAQHSCDVITESPPIIKPLSQTRNLRRAPIIHEDYEFFGSHHDIAILELAEPIVLTAYISNVLIPTTKMQRSAFMENYTVSGWGYDPEVKGRDAMLKKTTVERHTDSTCASRWDSQFYPDSMTCAGGNSNEDACEGDSGGPLTCSRHYTHEGQNSTKKYVCGIVSFGKSNDMSYKKNNQSLHPCGANLTEWPGIYTDLAKHYKWVMHTTCQLRQKHDCGIGYEPCCNKLCIPDSAFCDGFEDCEDGYDEKCNEEGHVGKCNTTDVCPKLGTKFLAFSPKFIYSFSTYPMGIFVQAGNNSRENYKFIVKIESDTDSSAVPESSIIVRQGQVYTLNPEVNHLRSSSYRVYIKVEDENDETFRYIKKIVRGGDVRIFMHTDKRAYSAGETIHFGIHFLDYDLEQHENVTGEILLLDSKSNELGRWDFPNETRALLEGISLGQNILGGTWKIKASYSFAWNDELFNRVEELDFEVRARANPDFTMELLGLPEYIPTLSAGNRKVPLSIDAYHFDGTGVLGECAVELKIIEESCARELSQGTISETIPIHGSTDVRNFDFNDILTEGAANGARIQVKVTLTEKTTGMALTKISTVRISRFTYKIQAFGMNNFKKVSLPFFVSFRILNTTNELLEPGGWVNVLHDFDGKSGRIDLKRGMVELKLNTQPRQANNVVQVTYKKLTLNYNVPPWTEYNVCGSASASLQIRLIHPISPNNAIELGGYLRIHVMTTKTIESVNTAIISNGKLISASSATLDSNSEFEIIYPEEIGQESQVVVFTFIDDVYVSDSLDLITLTEPEAPKTVKAWLSASASLVEPGGNVNLTVSVTSPSNVYLIGFEASSLEGQEDFLTSHWFARLMETSRAECWPETSSGYFDLKRAGMAVQTNAPNQTSTPGENDCRPRAVRNCPRGSPMMNQMGETFITRYLINVSGDININATLPNRISSWVIAGFSIGSLNTCPNFFPRVFLKTFKPLSASIQLPFSIGEGETLQVPIFIHNHLAVADKCVVSLHSQSPTKASIPAHYTLDCPVNSTTKRSIPMFFSSIGINTVILKVEVGSVRSESEKSILVRSASEKRVYVKSSAYLAFPPAVNDGAISKPFLVGMGNPPELAIFTRERENNNTIVQMTQTTKLYLATDIVAFFVPNVNQLVRFPQSAVESKILEFTANLAILSYLDESKRNDSARRERAIDSLKSGNQFQRSLRGGDGSFPEFGSKESHRPIWLTSYIIRNLFLAQRYIYIDPHVLAKGLEFLKKQQQRDGSFREKSDISRNSHIPLTAFVLLTFVEGQRSSSDGFTFAYNDVIQGARNCFQAYYNRNLENNMGIDNAHAQVLMTYAEHVWNEANPNEDNGRKEKYWKRLLSHGKIDSNLFKSLTPELEVELLSYVALTSYLRGSFSSAVTLMNRVIYKGLSETGGFFSTKDTAVALMAMARIYGRGKQDGINYQISIFATHNGLNYVPIMKDHPMEHSLDVKEIPLRPNDRAVRLNAVGKGILFAQLVYSYFTTPKDRNGTFFIEHPKAQTEGKNLLVKICLRKNRDVDDSGLTVLEVNLPSGYNFLQIPTSQALGQVSGHRSHEFLDMNCQVRIMFSSISDSVKTCVEVQAIESFSVQNYAPVSIKAYQFYNVTRLTQIYYTVEK